MADRIVQLKDEQDNNIFPIAADNPNIVAVDLVEEVPALNDFMLPVGSILTMGTDADPNTLYPGTTWEIFTTGWLKGVSASESAGLPVNEQLPNITGTWTGTSYSISNTQAASETFTGALSATSHNKPTGAGTSQQSNYTNGIKFDASASSSVYTDNGHVQPAGKTVKIWIRTA